MGITFFRVEAMFACCDTYYLPDIVHEQCATNLIGCIFGCYLHASRMNMCTSSHIHWITTLQHTCFVICLKIEKRYINCYK